MSIPIPITAKHAWEEWPSGGEEAASQGFPRPPNRATTQRKHPEERGPAMQALGLGRQRREEEHPLRPRRARFPHGLRQAEPVVVSAGSVDRGMECGDE